VESKEFVVNSLPANVSKTFWFGGQVGEDLITFCRVFECDICGSAEASNRLLQTFDWNSGHCLSWYSY
jgi:hypothetical protein